MEQWCEWMAGVPIVGSHLLHGRQCRLFLLLFPRLLVLVPGGSSVLSTGAALFGSLTVVGFGFFHSNAKVGWGFEITVATGSAARGGRRVGSSPGISARRRNGSRAGGLSLI